MSEITMTSEKDYANQIAYQRKHIAAQENSLQTKTYTKRYTTGNQIS